MWYLLIWLLIGIIAAIAYIADSYKKKIALSLKDIRSILMCILIGPIVWLSVGMVYLTQFLEKHKDDSIIKFK